MVDERSANDMAKPSSQTRISAVLMAQQLVDCFTDGLLRELLPVLREQSLPFDSVSKLSAEDKEEVGCGLFFPGHQPLDQRYVVPAPA